MSLSNANDELARAFVTAWINAGATPELLEHALGNPRLMHETVATFQNDLARVVGAAKQHYYPALEDLAIDTKVRMGLVRAGITQVIQLCACSARGVLSLRNVGANSLRQIEQALGAYGLRLRGEDEPYARRVLELSADIKHESVALLHMHKPLEWYGLEESYKYLHIATIDDLMRRSEHYLRTAEMVSGSARAVLFNSFTVTHIVKTLRELGLSLRKE